MPFPHKRICDFYNYFDLICQIGGIHVKGMSTSILLPIRYHRSSQFKPRSNSVQHPVILAEASINLKMTSEDENCEMLFKNETLFCGALQSRPIKTFAIAISIFLTVADLMLLYCAIWDQIIKPFWQYWWRYQLRQHFAVWFEALGKVATCQTYTN